jgi:hypothetical protein
VPDPLRTPTGVDLAPKRKRGRPKNRTADETVSAQAVARVNPETFTPEKWAACIGYLCEGMSTADAVDLAGIPRVLLNGFLRTDPRIRAQWEEAKLAALRNAWDIEVLEDIMSEIAAGQTLKYAVEIKHDKKIEAFYRLVLSDPLVKEMYDEARKIQAEQMADDILEIADDQSGDMTFDGKGNSANVNRSRLRADTRKYIMAAIHHRRWGAKSTQEIDHKITVDHAARLEEARARAEGAVIDVTPGKQAPEPAESVEEIGE